MDISKLQAGTQELNMERFNLTESISNIVARYIKLMEQEGYHISFICERDAYVLGDEVKIGQALCNLINNAINYSGEIKRIIVRQRAENGIVTVSVEDNGEGIAKSQLEYIWDRYYKVDKTHKRVSVGTGLGLSIVKECLNCTMRNMGGKRTGKRKRFFGSGFRKIQNKQKQKERRPPAVFLVL